MTGTDPFVRYRVRPVQERTVDLLIGISKGIIADGTVNQQEAEALLSWLQVNEAEIGENPLAGPLVERLEEMLWDNVLDEDEAEELLDLLTHFSGGISQFGEAHRSSTLPLSRPAPTVIFEDRTFLLTGDFLFGNKAQCHQEIVRRAGQIAKRVTYGLDYLVIGTYAQTTWKHGSFGGKIEKAVHYRDHKGSGLAIISEEHWLRQAGL